MRIPPAVSRPSCSSPSMLHDDRGRVDAGAAIGGADDDVGAALHAPRPQRQGRRRDVVDPVAERERAGARGRRAVEDDVVLAGRRQDRARGEHELAERAQVRVQVERQRGVPGQAALVARADDPRLDPDTRGAARDDDAEVHGRTGERHPKDALGAGEGRTEAEADRALRVAVARDARRAALRRGLVAALLTQGSRLGGRERRGAGAEPVRDPESFRAAREHQIAGRLGVDCLCRPDRDVELAGHGHGGRRDECGAGRSALRLDRHDPGPAAAKARVRQLHGAGLGRVGADQSEAE